MTTALDVLLIETEPDAGRQSAGELGAAGHSVHRCYPPDAGDPRLCVALTGGTCPIDAGPIDVAVVAEDLPGPGSVFLNLCLDFHAPVRPGDEITAEVEVLEVRDDKPIAKLAATITRHDGVKVVSGTAVTYREPL